jgi:hypothetical protein
MSETLASIWNTANERHFETSELKVPGVWSTCLVARNGKTKGTARHGTTNRHGFLRHTLRLASLFFSFTARRWAQGLIMDDVVHHHFIGENKSAQGGWYFPRTTLSSTSIQ